MTDITQRLQIRYPIIQAPMAGVSTPELAAAVSNAGGLGSIALGASTVEQAREIFRKTKALTGRPINANLFCHAPAVTDPARENAWIEYLRPLFAEFGATPPAAHWAGQGAPWVRELSATLLMEQLVAEWRQSHTQ